MKSVNASIFFLKTALSLACLFVLAVLIFVLPEGILTTDWLGYRPILIGMYLTSVPFFISAYSFLKFLLAVADKTASSHKSRQFLLTIQVSALIVSVLYGFALPYIFFVAQRDDAPGVVFLAIIITFLSLLIGIFVSVLKNVLHKSSPLPGWLNSCANGIVLFMGMSVIVVCSVFVPEMAREEVLLSQSILGSSPFILTFWVLALPIFIGLFQTYKVVRYINTGLVQSEKSLQALQVVQKSAVAFGLMIVVAAVGIIAWAKGMNASEDVTPVVAITLILTFASCVVASLVSLVQRVLLQRT